MAKMPPKSRRGTTKSLKQICRKLRLPFKKTKTKEGQSDDEWPDIPDTPEQRALIKEHNERMRREHPNMVQINPPATKFKEDQGGG